ncbi:sensor histidine kinase [Paractinoplanes rishiriensis]
MMVLLTLLGLAVGSTAEIFLHRTLYHQIDVKLEQAMNPKPRGGGPYRRVPDRPSPGQEPGSIAVTFEPDGEIRGGQVTIVAAGGGLGLEFTPLSDAATAELAELPANGVKRNVTLTGYGTFRAAAIQSDDSIEITALSLTDTQDTLLRVALVTGAGVLITLVIAGWAGAFIVRGTLRPLRRVAATATRVSELRLDRGEVQLAQRVPERDTDPRTEVGQVGNALNRMLDHVGNALEARHASEMQVRQFVADASHELRTPLAAIRGYAELSRRSRAPVSDEIAHVLGRVESEAQRMTGLVEDLLLLARLDAGRPLGQDPVDLTMLVVDTVSDAHAAGPRHYWQLDVPDAPVTVVGDQQRLHQVLANLLANARTHTPEGTSVTVRVDTTRDAATVQVIDAGPGIPPELQPHIFERFARGDSSRSRAAGSTGLGLSIVHAVVTAHGGTVSMQSAPGQTVFTVALPLTGQSAVSATGQLARSTPPGR